MLVLFQFKFLPYHSHPITWTIRLLIVLDLIAVLVLWRAARRPSHNLTWRLRLQGWMAWLCAAALAAFSWVALTFPGEPHAHWTRFEVDDPLWQTMQGWPGRPPECRNPSPLHTPFFWFDRLSPLEVDVVDPEKLAKLKASSERVYAPSERKYTHSFRGRDFNCAYLVTADLRGVDLSQAPLRGARLVGANLEGADLRGGADLEGADLHHARLNEANLFLADLGNASLESAELMGANLGTTWLQGTSLKDAMLYGANLDNAQAQGADLSQVRLEGASLLATQLQGASLKGSYLQFAHLFIANLQGADLRGADLSAARLLDVGLQGADLSESVMTHARLSSIHVWRANNPSCTNVSIDHHVPDAFVPLIQDLGHLPRGTLPLIPDKAVPATSDNIKKFIENSVARISIAERKKEAIDRMQSGLAPPAQDDTAEIEAVWRKCAEISQHSKTEFENGRVAFLHVLFCATKTRVCVRDLYCDAKRSVNAVAGALLGRGFPDPASLSRRFAQLAQGMLGKDKPCAASGELDEGNKARLRAAAGDTQ